MADEQMYEAEVWLTKEHRCEDHSYTVALSSGVQTYCHVCEDIDSSECFCLKSKSPVACRLWVGRMRKRFPNRFRTGNVRLVVDDAADEPADIIWDM